MRAFFSEQAFELNETVSIKDDKAHHLIKVVRIKAGETILALNGKGQVSKLEILEVQKKSLLMKCLEANNQPKKKVVFDFLVGKVKRDAMDLVIRNCCELGVDKLFIANTEYSQRYSLNLERIEKLSISGIEQSNNPYLLEVGEVDLKFFDYSNYDQVIYFDSQGVNENSSLGSVSKVLVVIGPEGGFSGEEQLFLKGLNSHAIRLETAIMRTPTAVSCAVGHLYGRLSLKS